MTVRLIVAMSSDGVIGVGNELPWRLQDDLKHFKEITMGRTVVMGSKTFDSIGKPLPGRNNIVITRTPRGNDSDLLFVKEPPVVLDADVIGGAQIYQHYLQQGLVDELIVTFVDTCIYSKDASKLHTFPTDYFRNFAPSNLLKKQASNLANEHSFKIVRYIRR